MVARFPCRPTLALLAALTAAPTGAAGQAFGPDPYQPYTNEYRKYASPNAPITGTPNSGRRPALAAGRATTGRLDEALGLTDPDRAPDEALDPYRSRLGRSSRAPSATDERFYRDLYDRDQLYLAASREADPKRRAELMQQYRDAVSKSSRDAQTNARQPARASRTGRRTTGTNPAATTARTAPAGDAERLANDSVNGVQRSSPSAARAPARRPAANAATRGNGTARPAANNRSAAPAADRTLSPTEILNRSLERSRREANSPAADPAPSPR